MRLKYRNISKRSKLRFFKKLDGFSEEKSWIFQKFPKVNNFAVERDWKKKILETFKIWVFLKEKYRLFKKNLDFFFWKIAEGSNFAVECDWKFKFCRNVQILDSFFKKKKMGCPRKNLEFVLKSLKVLNLH